MNAPSLKDRLEKLRSSRGISMRALARQLKTSGYSLDKIFRGEIKTLHDKLLLRAVIESFGLTEDQFYQRTPLPKTPTGSTSSTGHKVPLYGNIPAGAPLAVDGATEPEAWVDAPPGLSAKKVFALRVKGNSMSPRFLHGDVVYLEPLDIRLGIKDPENPVPALTFERLDGRVVAALVDQEATLKQLVIVGKGRDYELELRPFNPEFSPLRIRPDHTVIFQGAAVKTVRDEA